MEKLSRKVMTEPPDISCKGIEIGSTDRLVHWSSDRLRLQVGVSALTEIESWPDSPAFSFDSRTIFQAIRSGPFGTGSFGLILLDVFENPRAALSFAGQKKEGARDVFAFRFRVPLEASHMSVRAGDRFVKTGFEGSFEINAATAELATLIFETDQLPPATSMCRSRFSIDYHMVLIGETELLLPIEGKFDTTNANRQQTRNVTTFSACHEYLAESVLRFDAGSPSKTRELRTAASEVAIPAGLHITLALTDLIPFNAAAGDPIAAKVMRSVRDPKSQRIVIPAGSIARGRIASMLHVYSPNAGYEVSLLFNNIEVNEVVSPISFRREKTSTERRSHNGLRPGRQEFSLPSEAEEIEMTVAISASNARYGALPVNWESKWITR